MRGPLKTPPRLAPSTPRGRGATDVRERIARIAFMLSWPVALAGLFVLVTEGFDDLAVLIPVALVGFAATWGMTHGLAEDHDLPFLLKVVAAAVLVRLGVAVGAHYLVPTGFFAPDQMTYESVGWRTLLYLQGEGGAPSQIRGTVEVGYFYWNALLYWIFGFESLAPKLFNCFFGAWAALVAYRIGGELAGKNAARNSALLAAFFPSLVLWSSLNLRDTIVVLLLGLLLWTAMRLRRRLSGGGFLALLATLAALLLFRDYMAVMAVFALVGSFFIAPDRRLPANVFIGLVLLGTAIFSYQQFGLGADWVEVASFEAIDEQRELLATGGTAFRPGVDVSTPLRGLAFLPIGLAFFFLAPFPWQLGSALSIMTLPEQVIWYGLLIFVVRGGWFLLKERFSRVEPILLFVIFTSAVYALVEGNAGTAYRHRAQMVLFLLIFAGVGLELWRLRRARKKKAGGAAGPGGPRRGGGAGR